jgi:hypothetical protein
MIDEERERNGESLPMETVFFFMIENILKLIVVMIGQV